VRLRLARRTRRATLALAAVTVVSCGHDAAFSPRPYTPGQPAGVGPIVRLTFNPGADLDPVWLPDGTGFFYTMERLDRPDRDRCLAEMPGAGGSIAREICNRSAASADSVDAFSAATVTGGGQMVYDRASAPIEFTWPLAPRFHDLVLATLAQPERFSVVESFPLIAPGGRTHDEAVQIHWLDDRSFVYLAQSVHYVPLCRFCSPDTLHIGLEIARVDLGGPAPALSILPGTDQASSLTTVGSDTVYFTVYGDSRVFRLALGSGALDVAFDFGAGATARDVQVSGRRLVAVVGGSVEFRVDSALGTIVRDRGGDVHVVDLPSGVDQPTPVGGLLFRHLALDPTGRVLIAEGGPIVIVGPDTTFLPAGDLWRLQLP